MIEILQLSDRLSVGDSTGLGPMFAVLAIVGILIGVMWVRSFTNPR